MFVGRRVNLIAGIRTCIVENTQDNDISWTVYTNCLDVDSTSMVVEVELLGVGYGTQSTIQYTIGGNNPDTLGSGDYYTGTGACRVFITSLLQDNEVSVSFVTELKTVTIPPLSQDLIGGAIGSVIRVGYAPFSRYLCNIYAQGTYTVQWRNDSGAVIYGFVIVTPTDKIRMAQGFYHPPSLRLEILTTVLNQIFNITHYNNS